MEELKFDSESLNEFFKKKLRKDSLTLEDLNEDIYNVRIDWNEGIPTEHDFELLGKMQSLRSLTIEAKAQIDMKKINEDYPNFQELTQSEKDSIMHNPKYSIYPRFNLKGLEHLKNLEDLFLDGIEYQKGDLDVLLQLEKLKGIYMEKGKIGENFEVPYIEGLKYFRIDDIDVEDLNIIKNITNVERLVIFEHGQHRNVKNLEVLRKFTRVEDLMIAGIEEVDKYIPEEGNLYLLSLRRCNISTLDFLNKNLGTRLKHVALDDNNLGMNQYDKIKEIRDNTNLQFTFEGNPIANELKKQVFSIEDEETRTKIAGMFDKKDPFTEEIEEVNGYDALLKIHRVIEGKNVLETLISTGLISCVEDIKIDIDNLDGISEETIEWISKEKEKKIGIKSFKGLTSDLIKRLNENGKIKYYVGDDYYAESFYDKNSNFYTGQDILEIVEAMETIKNSVPEDADDFEKVMAASLAIGMFANYDDRGCPDNEEYNEEMRKTTRSLKGVLKNGTAVCYGYALAACYVLEYMGVESRMVIGDGHAWNQVKINEEWYNFDLTWDYMNMRLGRRLNWFLLGDEEFNKAHTPDFYQKPNKCEKDYDQEKIYSYIRDRKKTVKFADLKNMAENTKRESNLEQFIKRAIASKNPEEISRM